MRAQSASRNRNSRRSRKDGNEADKSGGIQIQIDPLRLVMARLLLSGLWSGTWWIGQVCPRPPTPKRPSRKNRSTPNPSPPRPSSNPRPKITRRPLWGWAVRVDRIEGCPGFAPPLPAGWIPRRVPPPARNRTVVPYPLFDWAGNRASPAKPLPGCKAMLRSTVVGSC